MAKIVEINRSVSVTIQREQFEPVNSFYAIKAELGKDDDVGKVEKELDKILKPWAELEILKWKSPNRAITASKKLGLYNKPKQEEVPPPF